MPSGLNPIPPALRVDFYSLLYQIGKDAVLMFDGSIFWDLGIIYFKED
jgi:hypothetical protein